MMMKLMPARMIPGLCAAVLLAACSSGSDSMQDGSGTGDMASLNSTGGAIDGTDGGITGGALAPGSAQDFETNVGNTVHFDTDSYSLNAEAQTALQKQAVWLNQYPQHTVTIEGHADERGTREYNLALGERRAQTVMNYLTALGVNPGRLQEISYGKERPVCPDATDACWAENRRGVTAINN